MARLEKPSPRNASLSRRSVLAAGVAAGLAGCQDEPMTASRTPRLDMERLNREVAALADRAQPAALGVGLMNLESGEHFTYAGERRFPLQGLAALPVAAAAFAEADAGWLDLAAPVRIEAEQLSPPPSGIADNWAILKESTAVLLIRQAMAGDNTALDVLTKLIGGPGAVTAWLTGKRVTEVRVDRYAREILTEQAGLASFRPEWAGAAAFRAAEQAVPPQRRRAALQARLADPRDTATPRGMIDFLAKLDKDELISRRSSELLLRSTAIRRSALFGQRAFHHVPGDPPPVSADAGVLVLEDRRPYAVAVFLAGPDGLDGTPLLAELGAVLVRGAG